jgi:hypothetical protein
MRRFVLPACLLMAALTFSASADEKAKGTKVTFDGMTSTAPSTWVEQTPSNKMRFMQFKLPKVKGDKEDAELVIFKGLGGSSKANIDRWKAQFVAPKGKTADDISKESDIKIGGKEAKKVVVEGTFKYNPAPFNRTSKNVLRPDYKMIAIHFEGPKDIFHIKLTGPAKTVDSYAKGFDAWIKGFKE